MREITEQEREHFAQQREEQLARQKRRDAWEAAWDRENERREAERKAQLPQAHEDAAFVLAWVQKLRDAGLLDGVRAMTFFGYGQQSVALDARGRVVCQTPDAVRRVHRAAGLRWRGAAAVRGAAHREDAARDRGGADRIALPRRRLRGLERELFS